jgi:predicted nucleic acid-binding protein
MKFPRRLKGRSGVVLDTMVFIYLFEDDTRYAPACEYIADKLHEGAFHGTITPITTAEILVKPLLEKRTDIAEQYQSALQAMPNLTHMTIDDHLGAMAGALRAKYRHPLPDMFQAAAALRAEKPTLITNDKALKKVTELDVILLEEFE